uniref:10 kDa putative secreted protein n=1 Tax=Argas monolakensis TaxID=34602 RepID=Q09JL9_ARGMO|nr:10 kDa putative secreted protein [Argas monolakensis]
MDLHFIYRLSVFVCLLICLICILALRLRIAKQLLFIKSYCFRALELCKVKLCRARPEEVRITVFSVLPCFRIIFHHAMDVRPMLTETCNK